MARPGLTANPVRTCATGVITEFGTGYPGYNTIMPKSCGSIAEILKLNGWNTSWFGKNRSPTATAEAEDSRANCFFTCFPFWHPWTSLHRVRCRVSEDFTPARILAVNRIICGRKISEILLDLWLTMSNFVRLWEWLFGARGF